MSCLRRRCVSELVGVVVAGSGEVLVGIASSDELVTCHNERVERRSRLLIFNGVCSDRRRIGLSVVVVALNAYGEHAGRLVVALLHLGAHALLRVSHLSLVLVIRSVHGVVVAVCGERLVQLHGVALAVGSRECGKRMIVDELHVVDGERVAVHDVVAVAEVVGSRENHVQLLHACVLVGVNEVDSVARPLAVGAALDALLDLSYTLSALGRRHLATSSCSHVEDVAVAVLHVHLLSRSPHDGVARHVLLCPRAVPEISYHRSVLIAIRVVALIVEAHGVGTECETAAAKCAAVRVLHRDASHLCRSERRAKREISRNLIACDRSVVKVSGLSSAILTLYSVDNLLLANSCIHVRSVPSLGLCARNRCVALTIPRHTLHPFCIKTTVYLLGVCRKRNSSQHENR